MHSRRLIAFVAFVAAVWLAARSRDGEFLGMLDPVVFLVAVLVAIVALLAAVFDIRLGKPKYEDSGFGVHEPVGIGLGKLGLLLFAVVPPLIAARGVYRGVIPVLGSDHVVAFSQTPFKFLVVLGAWIGAGVAVLALGRRVSGSSRVKSKRRHGR